MKLFGKPEKQKELELRKWCVEQSLISGRPIDEKADIIYRYVTTGDATVLEEKSLRAENYLLERENKELKEKINKLERQWQRESQ